MYIVLGGRCSEDTEAGDPAAHILHILNAMLFCLRIFHHHVSTLGPLRANDMFFFAVSGHFHFDDTWLLRFRVFGGV